MSKQSRVSGLLPSLPVTYVSLRIFFIITFILSWLVWIPLVLSHFEIGNVSIPEETSETVRLLGVVMPAFSALILTAIYGKLNGLKELLQPIKRWKTSWLW
jgi:hypothetical protein